MHISVFTHDSNPAVDPRTFRKSRAHCEQEVAAGRARQVNPADIRKGIQLFPPDEIVRKSKTEHRGSPQSANCLSARESMLQSDYRRRDEVATAVGEGRACLLHHVETARLSREYEQRLEQHIADGRKGTPRMCAVIAARVKTILSDPILARG